MELSNQTSVQILPEEIQFSQIFRREIISQYVFDQLINRLPDIMTILNEGLPECTWYLQDNWWAEMKTFHGQIYLGLSKSIEGERVPGTGFNMNPEQIRTFNRLVHVETLPWDLGKGMSIKKEASQQWMVEKSKHFSLNNGVWDKLCMHKDQIDMNLQQGTYHKIFDFKGVSVQVGWRQEEFQLKFIPVRRDSGKLVYPAALHLSRQEWEQLKGNVMENRAC